MSTPAAQPVKQPPRSAWHPVPPSCSPLFPGWFQVSTRIDLTCGAGTGSAINKEQLINYLSALFTEAKKTQRNDVKMGEKSRTRIQRRSKRALPGTHSRLKCSTAELRWLLSQTLQCSCTDSPPPRCQQCSIPNRSYLFGVQTSDPLGANGLLQPSQSHFPLATCSVGKGRVREEP